MLVIITGSRNYSDFPALCRELDALGPSEVWSGGARGADNLGKTWAAFRGVKYREFPPDWEQYGRAAGIIRSKRMVSLAPPGSVVAAFIRGPLSGSKGTEATVKAARKEGLKVRKVYQWE